MNSSGFDLLRATSELRTTNGVADPQTLLVDQQSIDQLLENRRDLVDVETPAVLLGISEAELVDLIGHGCLKAISGPRLDGLPRTRLERSSISDLCSCIARQSEPTNAAPMSARIKGSVFSTREVRRELAARGLSFGLWVSAVLARKLTALKIELIFGSGYGRYSLSQFVFSKAQIEQYLCESRTAKPCAGRAEPPMTGARTWREKAELLSARWDRQQQSFTRQGLKYFDVEELARAAPYQGRLE